MVKDTYGCVLILYILFYSPYFIFMFDPFQALLFPGHYYMTMYDMDGTQFSFPIRLYACALICKYMSQPAFVSQNLLT